MKASLRVTSALVVASVSAVACGRQTPLSEDLQRDLQQASSSSVELAPRAPKTAVVSAIELGQSESPKVEAPQTTPARRAPQRAKAPAQTQRTPVRRVAAVKAPEPEPQPVAAAPAVVAEAPAPTEAPARVTVDAPAPAPAPVPTRGPSRGSRGGRGGGWWSTGDVIRNAPFPVNP